VNRVQVVARERILHLEFDQHAQGISTLVVELMGNRANLILLDAGGIILDAMRRVPASVSRARAIVPRGNYFPPPPQAKADPLNLTPAQLQAMFERAEGDTLAERLVASVAGTSPLLAREIAFRVTGTDQAAYEPTCVTKTFEQLTRVWQGPAAPSVAFENDLPVAVAAFALTRYPASREIPSMSAALELFYGADESYEAVKAPLREQIEAALARLERNRASLARELVPEDEVETLKLKGEMILGYQYELKEGQALLRAPVSEELTLDISLDPGLSAVENANRYFDEYKRARDARARVPERIAAVENDIAYAAQVLNDLALAESRLEIDQAAEQAREAGLVRETPLRASSRPPRSEPRTFRSAENFQVLLGRNARQNDALTFERAKPDDVWLHARGHAGSHVVILSNGAPVPPATLEFAAGLAAYYSQARSEGAVDVIYAPRKNVHRVRGAGAHPGLVTVKGEQVVRVRPLNPESF
jgi:predicted ribosome quality control (RQC) complex YloA/Tae2 family protein